MANQEITADDIRAELSAAEHEWKRIGAVTLQLYEQTAPLLAAARAARPSSHLYWENYKSQVDLINGFIETLLCVRKDLWDLNGTHVAAILGDLDEIDPEATIGLTSGDK